MSGSFGVLALSAALAVAPGGFRIEGALPVRSVGVRPVLVLTPGEPSVFQAALDARFTTQRLILDASVPFVATWEPRWSDVGLGQLRLGGYGSFGRERTQMLLGFELALPAAPRWGRVSAWGSLARESLPGGEALAVFEITGNPDAPRSFRFAAGFVSGRSWASGALGVLPIVDLGFAQVVPIDERFAVVLEGELAVDYTPLSARALWRTSSPKLSLDVGVQLPLVAYGEGVFTAQFIGQLRRWF